MELREFIHLKFFTGWLLIFSSISEVFPSSTNKSLTSSQVKLRHQDVWIETNDSIVLNCSLRVNKDQHVVWHRKYDKMSVHVLTIGSETFISDLRIRPIKQQFISSSLTLASESGSGNLNNNNNNELIDSENNNNLKVTWNLEIRRLKKEDSALYYCVLNSENSYGQIYKLNVLSHLSILNKSEILAENVLSSARGIKKLSDKVFSPNSPYLMCKYDDLLVSPHDQIRWHFNKLKIKSNNKQVVQSTKLGANLKTQMLNDDLNQELLNSFQIVETQIPELNSTVSKLYIHNFNPKLHVGKYRCQFRGVQKSVRIVSHSKNAESSNRLVYKQSIYSLNSSTTSVFNLKSVRSLFIFNALFNLICAYLL